jgi:hypothetical protein
MLLECCAPSVFVPGAFLIFLSVIYVLTFIVSKSGLSRRLHGRGSIQGLHNTFRFTKITSALFLIVFLLFVFFFLKKKKKRLGVCLMIKQPSSEVNWSTLGGSREADSRKPIRVALYPFGVLQEALGQKGRPHRCRHSKSTLACF